MTMERIILGAMVIIGIILIIVGVLGAMYLGILLPFAVLIIMGGVALIIISIILYFLLL